MLASLYNDSKEGNSTIKVCPKADCKEIIYCTSPEEVIVRLRRQEWFVYVLCCVLCMCLSVSVRL